MFQVTKGGEIVWEYINPYFHQGPAGGLVNSVFRATHYLPEEIPALSPNPPKDTDGGREYSGRGWVGELQGRWPGVLG